MSAEFGTCVPNLPPRVLGALARANGTAAAVPENAPRCPACGHLCPRCTPREGLPAAYQVATFELPDAERRPVFLGEHRNARPLNGDPDARAAALARRVLAELEPPPDTPGRANRLPGGVRSADEIRAGLPARPRIRCAGRLPG